MKYPWMPLFWGDFLANTLHLSAQEVGAYFLLIAHAWEHEARVCVKDAPRIARVNNRHWAKVSEKLAAFFDPPGGLRGNTLEVIHPRVAKELANAGELSNKRKGAALQMHANRRASASILHMHLQSHSIESSNCEEGEATPVQMHPRPQPTAAWHPRIDEGDDYRSPSRKTDDPPLTDRPDLAALHAKGGK